MQGADAVPDGYEPGQLPSRNQEWDSPFESSPRDVNAERDAARMVVTYSVVRRRVAIGVTVLLVAWLTANVVDLVLYARAHPGEDELRVFGVIPFAALLFQLAFAAIVGFAVWRWANRPVTEGPR